MLRAADMPRLTRTRDGDEARRRAYARARDMRVMRRDIIDITSARLCLIARYVEARRLYASARCCRFVRCAAIFRVTPDI